MKVLRADEPGLELMQREATVLKYLTNLHQHEGIPKVESQGEFDVPITSNGSKTLHCLVMEKIEGQDLKQWLNSLGNQPISEELARDWLRQIAQILEGVHSKDLVHRDIKPSNIMRRPDGKLVLIDFGTIKVVGLGVTRIGTPGYMAPEQQEHGQSDQRSDFFALGRTFAHLLTGKDPDIILKNSPVDKFDWRESVPQISPQFANLIDEMMARSADDRPENAQSILQRLDQLPSPSSLPTKSSTSHLFGSEHNLLVLLITFVLGAAFAQVFHFLRSENSTEKNSIVCPQAIIEHQHISCGENKLVPKPYPEPDPEDLIYTNNQRMGKEEAYTIAVVAPLNTGKKGIDQSGLEIIRGVAQAQDEVDKGERINGRGLIVAIADDADDRKQGE